MSKGSALIVRLEKVRAALGAAGMAAIAAEVFGPRGVALPITAALMSAIAAYYFTDVSDREAALATAAAKEGILANALDR